MSAEIPWKDVRRVFIRRLSIRWMELLHTPVQKIEVEWQSFLYSSPQGSKNPYYICTLMAESLNWWKQTNPMIHLKGDLHFGVRARTKTFTWDNLLYFHASATIRLYGSDRGVCSFLQKIFQRVKKILFDGFGVENKKREVRTSQSPAMVRF